MTRSISSRVCRLGYLGIVVCVGVAVACGNTSDSLFDPANADGGDVSEGGNAPFFAPSDGSADSNAQAQGDLDAASVVIAPADAVVTVTSGAPKPTLTYSASSGGKTVPVSWSIDRGEIGTIDAKTGVFTPAGTVGGKATVTADYRGIAITTSVTVKIKATQDGDPAGTAPDGGAVDGGPGGWGGVGGEGLGLAPSAATKAVLQGAPAADVGLSWLYPYDGTVWPRGLLAPLLQWDAPRDYDAVYIHITENNFEYQGYFNKTAAPFIHHPVPQAIWDQIGYSNGGEDVTVSLVFAAGGQAYGPVTQKWKIAKGALKGTVYYNSYGTDFVHNYGGKLPSGRFGAATLAIRPGATAPALIAGSDSATDGPGCRVCHSVSANGSTLVTNRFVPSDSYSSAYNLTASNAETAMSPGDGRYSWPALSPDGTFLFSNTAPLQGAGGSVSQLYQVPDGGVIDAGGLPPNLGAGTPSFSPDGKHVAFNFWGGAGADQKSLANLDFDPATKTFSGLKTLFTPGAGGNPGLKVWYPSFLPTNDSVIFHLETVSNGGVAETRTGVRSELWWIDLATKSPVRLDKLNGAGYLPAHQAAGANANDDQSLNYEPTVNPVPSGGYAWVVFTSRRRYGNIATRNPFDSDPRFSDLTKDPTPKKLWVAAIDLNAPAGTDPSHAAFYLPAQELLAGNSRGYWVVDPCRIEGTDCVTGDECCGGYCRPGKNGSALVCSTQKPPGCVQEFDKCATTSDCCLGNGISCINGRCAQSAPPTSPK